MANTYRPRWRMAFAVSLPRGIVAGTAGTLAGMLVALLLGQADLALRLPIVWPFVTVGATIAKGWQVRSSRLTAVDHGLVLTRNRCRITLLWRDFDRVRERRVGLIRLSELVFHAGDVRPIDPGAPLAVATARKFQRTGTDRRIMPGLYLADWRDSPLGVV